YGAAFYVFYEFPNSRRLEFTLSGTGDADLFVLPAERYDPDDPDTWAGSQRPGTSKESITVHRDTRPSVDLDDVWLVLVIDYPSDGVPSTYQLRVAQTLPKPDFAVNQSFAGSIDAAGEFDFVAFN